LMIIMLVLGGVSLLRLNTQFFPDFGIDMVSITVIWPGASAEDVEANIVAAIEPEVRFQDNVERVVSFAVEGVATVLVEYHQGSDMQAALSEVDSAVAQVTTLPEDAEKPVIRRVARYETMSRLALSGPYSEAALKSIAKRMREDLLARGIDRVLLYGSRDEEIWVDISPATLRRLDLTLDSVAARIRGSSLDLPSGNIEGRVEKQIRSLGLETTATGVGGIEIRSLPNGEKIHLRDIAKVREAFDTDAPEGRLSRQRAIELHIKRAVSADALDVAETVEQYLSEIRPTLPPTLRVEHYDVQAGLIRERIAILLKNGAGGLTLVLLILFIFLNLRVAIWVAAGIPVALLATMVVMLASGQSINMVSLFALIMTLGIIVDDAIVVGEHAAWRRSTGQDALEAAEGGALRMLPPVVASSLTTIAAFLPLLVIGDIIGIIIRAIPLVAISVLLASLVECFLILPGHLRGALKVGTERDSAPRKRFNRAFARFRDGWYRRVLVRCLEWRYLTMATAIASLILTLGIVGSGRIDFHFFPAPEGDVVYGNVVMMPGTPRGETEAMARELEHAARRAERRLVGDQVLIHATFGSLGQSQANEFYRVSGDKYGGLYIELIPSDHRQIRLPHFIEAWRQEIKPRPGVERISLNERRGGPPGREIDIRLSGGGTDDLKAAARELKALLLRFPGVSDVEDDLPYGKQEVILELTPRGRALGFTTDSVGRQVRSAFQGAIAKRFPRGDEEVTVKVQYPRGLITTEDLLNLYLRGPAGAEVPLSEVVTMRESAGFARIRREDGQREVAITGELDESKINLTKLTPELEAGELPKIARRHGVNYRFAGKSEEQSRTLADMRLGALVGLAAIYIILAWVFASYTRPIVVMSIIPFGVVGAVIGHMLLGFDLSLLTLVGLLGLSGILVNDSIILVSTIDERIAAGEEVFAAIVAGSQDRLRAVLLTSLTTIGGLTPLLFETSLQAQFLIPMAITIIFGLAVATLLVLVVVPALLAIQQDIGDWRRRGGRRAVLRRRKWRAFRAAAPMARLRMVLDGVDRLVCGIGFWTALIALPVMIVVRIYEITARKLFNTSSPLPQYIEWEVFMLLVLLTLGYAYVRDAHVRVDILRERLRPVTRARIELLGLILFFAPFALVVIAFGLHLVAESFADREVAALTLGAPGRWLIKAAMPVGLALFLAAAVAAALRNLRRRGRDMADG
ncbi:MAG: efflux RND transporter permease subunit, partial [Alphaproteobacteria bacterium]|nr:efflux RND transporter permease subunit [Alphaproteobacteria bacterium]